MKKSLSLKRQLTVLMAFLVVLQSVALIMALSVSRVFFLLDSESFRLFSNTTNVRMLSFNESAGKLIGNVSEDAEVLNESLNDLARRYEVEAGRLYENDEAYMEAAITGSRCLIDSISKNHITGAFFILNRSNSNKDSEQAHSAVYIRDSAPDSAVNNTGSYFLEIGPISVSQQYKVPASINRQLDLQFESEDQEKYSFYYKPIEASAGGQKPEYQHYGYWSEPVNILKDNQSVIYYTVPIYDEYGKAFGVYGVEISLAYFTDFYLPNTDLPYSNSFYAIAPVYDNTLSFEWFIPSGPLAQVYLNKDERIELESVSEHNLYEARLGELGDMYLSVQPLKVYDSNSPFIGDSWSLIGFVPQNILHESSSQVRGTLAVSIAATTALSFLAIFMLVHIATRKISGLSAYVESLSPKQDIRFARTGMKEIDDLTSAVEMLNKRVIGAFETTSKVLELTRLPLGMFEVSYESDEVTLTDYIFTLLHLDRDIPVQRGDWEDIYEKLTAAPEHDYDCTYKYEDQWLRILEEETDTGRVGIIFDVTDDIEENKRLIRELDFDALTQLYNRTAFKREVFYAIQGEPDSVGAMIFADLDNLKYINDTYGHDVGDRLIIRAGEMYGNFSRFGGIAARISGDEFAVYLHGFSTKDEIREILRFQLKENEAYTLETPDENMHRIRASTGIAWYPEDSGNATDLLKLADFAMYESKKKEKGSIHEFDTKTYQEKAFLLKNREAINLLLDERLIRFAFQPIVDLKTGEIYAYEALMRPMLEDFKSPLEILSVAADQSKLAQLERLVWMTALQYIDDNKQQIGDTKIFINSIANQCISVDDGFLLQKKYGDLFGNIVIEITEAENNKREVMDDKIAFIRNLGMELAIDDYGSGYSNDLRILSMNPEVIKIDMGMIQGIHEDVDKRKLVENLVSFSRQKNIKLVAEGVEELADMEEIIKLGVDYVQGYYVARPSFGFVRIDDTIKEQLVTLNKLYGES